MHLGEAIPRCAAKLRKCDRRRSGQLVMVGKLPLQKVNIPA